MKKKYLFSQTYHLVLVLFLVTSCNGQSETDNVQMIEQTKVEQINKLVSTYADYGLFNGTVLVANQGKIILKKGFGFANMEWDIPNQPDTKFRLASITKQFTAMLILQLVSEKKLDLNLPISTYLPDYPKKNGDQITIHHLLTHTSGTPRIDDFIRHRDMERDRYRPNELLKIFAEGELNSTPGEKFSYSNEGYKILGVIIEKITGTSYEKALQDKIFTPLEMFNTGFDHNNTIVKKRASGYSRLFDGEYINTNYIDMSIPYAAGSIYSTVEDLFLWDKALYTEKLLPKKYNELLFKTHISARDQHYGYGWFIGEIPIGNTKNNVQTNHHGGGINGFNTRITRIQSNKSLIVLLNNTDRAPLYEMTIAINGILHNESYDFPKKSIANTLFDIIDKEGIDKGIQFFEKFKDNSTYYLSEKEMNIVSYKLLQSDRAEIAADVLKLAIEAFPNAFNLYDSYGEVLLTLGKKEKAIENYRKSVDLNPENKNGIRVLKELGVE